MSESIHTGLKICWVIISLVWVISGFTTKQVKSQEPRYQRFIQYWLPLLVAFYLLGPGEWFGHSLLRENFVSHSNLVGIIGLVCGILGTAIACWSRIRLGRNWSLAVQQKQDHELITSGIYSVVRHPIYTGLLMLFIGNGIIVGDYRAILAVIIVFISFWFKLKKEEQLLIETFGDRYITYKQHTKALIPYIL